MRNANDSTKNCIADNCGMPFDSSISETRAAETLRPFWMRYCPKHRVTGERYEAITEQRPDAPVKPVKVISIDSTECRTWFERDRQHVNLVNKLTDETIIEFWDESVSEAIEDGFLNPRDYHQSAYDYAKYIGILPAAPKHYIAMSGSHGCLPDNCEVFDTRKAAVDSLVSLFELGRTRKARLNKNGYLELVASPIEQAQDVSFGAAYCEITECDCDNPAQHSDSL